MPTYAAPKHRNVIHLHAKMKTGAGTHSDKRPARGPSADEWDFELDEDSLNEAVDMVRRESASGR